MKTLVGSLFGKRLRVVIPHENEMETIVICPYCGRKVAYGETRMICGVVYCPYCREECIKQVMFDREFDYKAYQKKDYQPYGVTLKEAMALED